MDTTNVIINLIHHTFPAFSPFIVNSIFWVINTAIAALALGGGAFIIWLRKNLPVLIAFLVWLQNAITQEQKKTTIANDGKTLIPLLAEQKKANVMREINSALQNPENQFVTPKAVSTFQKVFAFGQGLSSAVDIFVKIAKPVIKMIKK